MSAADVRTALVLGGGSDIALATLRALRPDGLERVVLALRDPAAVGADPVPGVDVVVRRWDATDVASHDELVEAAAEELGRIDVVLCAVGLLGHHAGISMGAADVEAMVLTNFAGPAAALAAVGRLLERQRAGTAVVLSSVAGVRPRRSNYVYGSTKSGLDAFARGLGDALVGSGARVLVVRPGFVRSSMTEGLEPAPFSTTPDVVAEAIRSALSKRRGGVVWVPARLGPLFGVLANAPSTLWRRIAGDR